MGSSVDLNYAEYVFTKAFDERVSDDDVCSIYNDEHIRARFESQFGYKAFDESPIDSVHRIYRMIAALGPTPDYMAGEKELYDCAHVFAEDRLAILKLEPYEGKVEQVEAWTEALNGLAYQLEQLHLDRISFSIDVLDKNGEAARRFKKQFGFEALNVGLPNNNKRMVNAFSFTSSRNGIVPDALQTQINAFVELRNGLFSHYDGQPVVEQVGGANGASFSVAKKLEQDCMDIITKDLSVNPTTDQLDLWGLRQTSLIPLVFIKNAMDEHIAAIKKTDYKVGPIKSNLPFYDMIGKNGMWSAAWVGNMQDGSVSELIARAESVHPALEVVITAPDGSTMQLAITNDPSYEVVLEDGSSDDVSKSKIVAVGEMGGFDKSLLAVFEGIRKDAANEPRNTNTPGLAQTAEDLELG